MLAPTHSVFGIFLTLIVLAVFGVQWGLHWTIIVLAVLGSIMPDIDHPSSVIGRLFLPISRRLERRFGHRTFTHSLLGWAIASAIFAVLIFLISLFGFVSNFGFSISDLVPRWIAAFSLGYFSHLVLDMFNKSGSQMFWPNPGRDVIPKDPKFRPASGSKVEVVIFLILLALMFMALPISKYGLSSSLHWLLATPGAAIEEFKGMKDHTYVDFEGVISQTRAPVSGKAEILDVRNRKLIVLFAGQVYILSDELPADILATRTRAEKTDIPIKTETIYFKDETRDALLARIPAGALVSGTVHLPEGMVIDFPVFPAYKTMDQKGDGLVLSFATREQIEKLALSESYDLQIKQDQVALVRLYVEKEKVRVEINKVSSANGLTPLGRQLLMSREEAEKQKLQLAELNSQLGEIGLKIEEFKVRMKARRFVFSGEVYLRR